MKSVSKGKVNVVTAAGQKNDPDSVHRCPVCNKGIGIEEISGTSMKQNYMKYKKDAEFNRKKLEVEWEGRRVKRSDEETIVAATCGELFHKACLMKHCSGSFKSGDHRRCKILDYASKVKPRCPRCNRQIMYSLHQEIDVEGHRPKGTTKFEKELTAARIMNHELTYKLGKDKETLGGLEKKLEASRTMLKSARKRQAKLSELLQEPMEIIQEKIIKVRNTKLEKKAMEVYIQNAQRVIEVMQNETPKIMRLYLREVQTRPLDEIAVKTPIPRILIPYLPKISEDKYCLIALSQIIRPRPYPGTHFNRDSLILGILRKVNPSLGQKLRLRASKLKCGILDAYEDLFPDQCLNVLRNVRQQQDESHPIIRTAEGKQLAIRIMYVLDDEDREDNPSSSQAASSEVMPFAIKVPSSIHCFAEKGSNFTMASTANLIEKSVTKIIPPSVQNNNNNNEREVKDKQVCTSSSLAAPCDSHLKINIENSSEENWSTFPEHNKSEKILEEEKSDDVMMVTRITESSESHSIDEFVIPSKEIDPVVQIFQKRESSDIKPSSGSLTYRKSSMGCVKLDSVKTYVASDEDDSTIVKVARQISNTSSKVSRPHSSQDELTEQSRNVTAVSMVPPPPPNTSLNELAMRKSFGETLRSEVMVSWSSEEPNLIHQNQSQILSSEHSEAENELKHNDKLLEGQLSGNPVFDLGKYEQNTPENHLSEGKISQLKNSQCSSNEIKVESAEEDESFEEKDKPAEYTSSISAKEQSPLMTPSGNVVCTLFHDKKTNPVTPNTTTKFLDLKSIPQNMVKDIDELDDNILISVVTSDMDNNNILQSKSVSWRNQKIVACGNVDYKHSSVKIPFPPFNYPLRSNKVIRGWTDPAQTLITDGIHPEGFYRKDKSQATTDQSPSYPMPEATIQPPPPTGGYYADKSLTRRQTIRSIGFTSKVYPPSTSIQRQINGDFNRNRVPISFRHNASYPTSGTTRLTAANLTVISSVDKDNLKSSAASPNSSVFPQCRPVEPVKFAIECETRKVSCRTLRKTNVIRSNEIDDLESGRRKELEMQRGIARLCIDVNPPSPAISKNSIGKLVLHPLESNIFKQLRDKLENTKRSKSKPKNMLKADSEILVIHNSQLRSEDSFVEAFPLSNKPLNNDKTKIKTNKGIKVNKSGDLFVRRSKPLRKSSRPAVGGRFMSKEKGLTLEKTDTQLTFVIGQSPAEENTCQQQRSSGKKKLLKALSPRNRRP